MGTVSTLPRPIAPELVEIGDKVRVTYKAKDGVTQIVEGVVAERYDAGEARHMMTAEGGRLFVWGGRYQREYKLTLLDRPPAQQMPLFADIGDIRDMVV